MNTPKAIFIGFRVKEVSRDTAWLHKFGGSATRVTEICSVSECISEPPPNWENRWDFNRFCCYNSEAEALATIPTGAEATIRTGHEVAYELFAYRMSSMRFDKAGVIQFVLNQDLSSDTGFKCLPPESDLSSYASIGHDLAGGPVMNTKNGPTATMGFSCSPLSCNGCAGQFKVNRYCLIDDLDEAIRAGEEFGRTEPEPGPFYLYEVLRKRSGRWAPEHR